MDCNIKTNKNNCNCTYNPCARKGKCCECIIYHKNFNELPACFFPKEVEKTFDRSIKKFIDAHR